MDALTFTKRERATLSEIEGIEVIANSEEDQK